MSHLSPKLHKLRDELFELNQKILSLVDERKLIVREIQQEKTKPLSMGHFDAAREVQLFKSLKASLKAMEMGELLAFSILMETQAGAPEYYPAWSNGIHLNEAPQHHEHRINPFLLREIHPDRFMNINLRSDFRFLLSI